MTSHKMPAKAPRPNYHTVSTNLLRRVAFIDGTGDEYHAGLCAGLYQMPASVQAEIRRAARYNGHVLTVNADRMVHIVKVLGGEVRESHRLGTEYWLPRKVPASRLKALFPTVS